MSNPEDQQLLTNLLQENGIQVDRIERVLPSLEDAFVSLVDQENRLHVRAGID